MENVFNAFSLSVVSQLRFVLISDDPESAVLVLISKAIDVYGLSHIVVDMKDEPEVAKIIQLTTTLHQNGEGIPILVNAIIMKNLENTSPAYQRKIIHYINALDSYNTYALQIRTQPVCVEEQKLVKPDIFVIVPVIRRKSDGMAPNLVPYLRHKFAFSQFYNYLEEHQAPTLASVPDLLKLRLLVDQVHISPEIRGYIYSLLVHIRTHRLCSLNSIGARPPTSTLDWIRDLAAAMVVWHEHARPVVDSTGGVLDTRSESLADTGTNEKTGDSTEEANSDTIASSSTISDAPAADLFVTPLFVKSATRKVTYFQVDWELDTIFSRDWTGSEKRQQQEITMLTGDWFGSEWTYVRRYIDHHRSQVTNDTPTGISNDIVEEAIERVRPPI